MKTPATTPQQDTAYTQLRQWITVGEVLPGQRLKIHDIAQRLGVGVMPVRAALQRLAAEGALVNVPHAGVMVPKLSVAEFDDVLDMRLMLEGTAAERGAHRIDADGVAALQALDERGGKLGRLALAQRLAMPEMRVSGMVSAARRVLNLDQAEILQVNDTDQSVSLNRALLSRQFGLPSMGGRQGSRVKA